MTSSSNGGLLNVLGVSTVRLNISRTLISSLVLVLSIVGMVTSRHARSRGVQLCSEVHGRCFGRDGCKFALENYFIHCMDVSDSPTYECTKNCKMALIMLLSSEEHDGPNAFRECDCQGEEFCLQQKERIANCQEDVQLSLDAINNPDMPIMCSLATLVCSADSMCLTAIDYYENHCKKLQDPHNPRCTPRCNNSLNILYRQSKAQKLRSCYCDGQEDYNCTALQKNTRDLCFGEATTSRVRHSSSHDHTRHGEHHPTPPAIDDDIDTYYEDDKLPLVDWSEYPSFDSTSRHNSVITIHSNAGLSNLTYLRTVTVVVTFFVTLFLLSWR